MSECYLIDAAIEAGCACEVFAMLTGESEFSDVEGIRNLDRFSRRLLSMTIMHVDMICKVSGRNPKQKIFYFAGKYFFTFPEFFEAWKLSGAPGISMSQLENMLRSKNINIE